MPYSQNSLKPDEQPPYKTAVITGAASGTGKGADGAAFECFYQKPLYRNFFGWSQIIAGLLAFTQRFIFDSN